MEINRAGVPELVDGRDLKCLASPESSHFFGKRDLAFGINLPEQTEIWKTLLGAFDGRHSQHCSRRCARCAGLQASLAREGEAQ
jgi:hypothetical protein